MPNCVESCNFAPVLALVQLFACVNVKMCEKHTVIYCTALVKEFNVLPYAICQRKFKRSKIVIS